MLRSALRAWRAEASPRRGRDAGRCRLPGPTASVGWPRQVAEALHDQRRPDLSVAPLMSPGARKAARDAASLGLTSRAQQISKSGPADRHRAKGSPPVPLDTRVGWRPAALAGARPCSGNVNPTVPQVVKATGISTGSVATALKFEHDGHLASNAARGPGAARRIVNRDELLNASPLPPSGFVADPITSEWLRRDPIVGTYRAWSHVATAQYRLGRDERDCPRACQPRRRPQSPHGDRRARTNAERSSPSRNSRWPRGGSKTAA